MNIQTQIDPTDALVEQARRVLPGGSFGNMPAEVILKEGKGGRVYDEAGREYVDFLLGSGPMFIGHAHPEVTAAVQAQARKAATPTVVHADGIDRYPRAVESAVYFSVLECLQNVAKYADAAHTEITLAQANGHLRFEVRDDGRGFDPASSRYGTGLQGIADRMDAVGGELSVRSSPGAGTVVVGVAPLG